MGGEAQGSVCLCRAHEEGPVKHSARPPPPLLRCYAQSLDRPETLANKFAASVCEGEFETCGLTVVSLSTSAAQHSAAHCSAGSGSGPGRKRAPETRGCQQVISIVSVLSSIEATPVLCVDWSQPRPTNEAHSIFAQNGRRSFQARLRLALIWRETKVTERVVQAQGGQRKMRRDLERARACVYVEDVMMDSVCVTRGLAPSFLVDERTEVLASSVLMVPSIWNATLESH